MMIRFGGYDIPIQSIPAYWSDLGEEQIATMLRLFYGTAAKIVTVEDGKRTVTWVVPSRHNP